MFVSRAMTGLPYFADGDRFPVRQNRAFKDL
jgi:hypothetical protein